MGVKNLINDLSSSEIKGRFTKKDFVPETNYAVAMGRVSIKKNKDKGNSDLAQLEHIEDYIRSKGLVLAREPWDVAETASKHDKRKKFLELIEHVEESQNSNKPIKHVVFAYTSRGSRNKKSKRMIEELLELGVTVHFTQDNLTLNSSSDMASWLTWEVKSIKDQEDIDKLKKHIWDGVVKRLENGLFPGKAPFGYKNFRDENLNNTSIFIFKEGACEYMKDAFEMFSTDLYEERELKRLLDAKYPKLKTPSLDRFSDLLRNPFYYGSFNYMGQLWKGHPEYHPPLITYLLWKRVQDVLKRRLNKKVSSKDIPYLGMIRCGGKLLDENGRETNQDCGHLVTAEEKRKKRPDGSIKKYYYYKCCNHRRPCSQRNKAYMKALGRSKVVYSESEIEEMFLQVYQPLNFSAEKVNWMIDMLQKKHLEIKDEHYRVIDALQSRYKMLKKYIDEAYEDKLRGDIPESLWREKNSKWLEERDSIKLQLESIQEDEQQYIENGIACIELLQSSEIILKNASQETKRNMVKLVVSNLSLRDGSIEIYYKKPFDILCNATSKQKWWTLAGSNR